MRPDDQRAIALRVSHCPMCGYPLTGLPIAGTCPECGERYDPMTEVVIFGWESGGGRGPLSRPIGTGEVLRWAVAISVCFCAHVLLWPTHARWAQFAINVLVAFAAPAILYLRARKARDLPGAVTVHISPRGFAKRIGPGRVKWQPWSKGDLCHVERNGDGTWRLWIARKAPLHVFDKPNFDVTFNADVANVAELRSQLEAVRYATRP